MSSPVSVSLPVPPISVVAVIAIEDVVSGQALDQIVAAVGQDEVVGGRAIGVAATAGTVDRVEGLGVHPESESSDKETVLRKEGG